MIKIEELEKELSKAKTALENEKDLNKASTALWIEKETKME